MKVKGEAMEIVSSIVIVGLAVIWFIAWRRGKRICNDLYNEELRQLKELYERDRFELLTRSSQSQRELEILSYVAHGYAKKEIAVKLKISSTTVTNSVSFII